MLDDTPKKSRYIDIRPKKYRLFDKIDMFAQENAEQKSCAEKEDKTHEQLRRPAKPN